jgi:hypothetical protein
MMIDGTWPLKHAAADAKKYVLSSIPFPNIAITSTTLFEACSVAN